MLTLEEWCNCFGFENRGVLESGGAPVAKAFGTWELISFKDEHDFASKKVSSIQTPTIRHFMTSTANTIFGRQHLGGMSSYDVCVIHVALHPNYAPKPNMRSFLMHHLDRQHKQTRGVVVVGGIVTRLAEHFGLDVDEMHHVPGPTVLNRSIMTNIYFIGPVQGGPLLQMPPT